MILAMVKTPTVHSEQESEIGCWSQLGKLLALDEHPQDHQPDTFCWIVSLTTNSMAPLHPGVFVIVAFSSLNMVLLIIITVIVVNVLLVLSSFFFLLFPFCYYHECCFYCVSYCRFCFLSLLWLWLELLPVLSLFLSFLLTLVVFCYHYHYCC